MKNLIVYENSEKYVITTQEKNVFLSFSKIKGTAEIIRLDGESDPDKNINVTVNNEKYIEHFFKTNIFHKTYEIVAIYGTITLEGNTYLIFVKQKELVGYIENTPVYKIKEVILSKLLIEYDENLYLLRCAREFFDQDGIYFSDFDLFRGQSFRKDEKNQQFEFLFNQNPLKNFLLLFENEQEKSRSVENLFYGNQDSESDDENVLRHRLASESEILTLDNELSGQVAQQNQNTLNNTVNGQFTDVTTSKIHFYKEIESLEVDLFNKYEFLNQFYVKVIFGSFEYFTICDHLTCTKNKECLLNSHNEIQIKEQKVNLSFSERNKLKFKNFFHAKTDEPTELQTSAQNFNILRQSASYTIVLLARRSYKNMGARYLRRGVNKDGDPANSVECEQIMVKNEIDNSYRLQNRPPSVRIYSNVLNSFIQLRGSIPLLWKQDLSFKYNPTIKVTKSYDPLLNYNLRMIQSYKSIFYLNLIKSFGPESNLNSFYCKALQDSHMKYLHYDFVREGLHFSKKKKRELLLLLRPILKRNKIYIRSDENDKSKQLSRTDNMSTYSNKSQVPDKNVKSNSVIPSNNNNLRSFQYQTGIVRTNCIDSLDRTNIVQYFIGEEMIREQVSSTNPNSSFLIDYVNSDAFHGNFKSLWIKNGHTLSKQYSGTNSLGSAAVFRAQSNNEEITSQSNKSVKSFRPSPQLRKNYLKTTTNSSNSSFSSSAILQFLKYYIYRLNDGKYSLIRYFINRFSHGDLQTSYDIITGSNMSMVKRKERTFSLLHCYICTVSVLFYMYYLFFYYGQDSTIHSFIIQKYPEYNIEKDLPVNTDLFQKLNNYTNNYLKVIIYYFYQQFEYFDIKKKIFYFYLLCKSLVQITWYDAVLLMILSGFFTLVVYPIFTGLIFNFPFYEYVI